MSYRKFLLQARSALILILISVYCEGNLQARKGIGPGPYEPLYLAKFMPMVPCSQLIEQILKPSREENPLADSQLLNQLTACETETNGAYAYITRKLLEGRIHIRQGNFFLGWESLQKGQERLGELPEDAPLRQYFLMTMGNSYQNTGAMTLSIPYLKEALEIHYSRQEPIRTNLLNTYNKLSRAYYELGNPDSSLYWSREGVRYCREFPRSRWYASSLNNLGLRLKSYGNLDSAMVYFQSAWAIQKESEVPAELNGAILDNIAEVHLKRGEHAEAYRNYRASFDFARRNRRRGRILIGGGKAITTILGTPGHGAEELKIAQEIMVVLDSLMENPDKSKVFPKNEYWLRAKVSLRMAEGKIALAEKAIEKYVSFRDSVNDLYNKGRLKALERFLVAAVEKYNDKLTLKDLEAQNSKETVRYILIIGVLLLFVLVFVGIILRNKVKNQRTELQVKSSQDKLKELELANAELKKKELEQELALQKRDMDDLAIEMRVRNKDRSDLIAQLEGILKTSSPTVQLQVLLNDLKLQTEHQQISEVRLGKMDDLGNGFKERLAKKFPQLTRTDLELCELFLLEVPVKEIAGIRKITPESVRMGRYRIRKKMGLDKGEDLRAFLKAI